MCFNNPSLQNLHQWNWDGETIVHDTTVPASRWVIGYGKNREYDIDIREFLISEKNELVKTTLQKDIRTYLDKIKGSWDLFTARKEGAFDYRADISVQCWENL